MITPQRANEQPVSETPDKNRKVWRRLFLVFLLLLSWILAWGAACGLIVRAPVERADAIVVLSGSAAYKERTRQAARLYAAGRAPRIVLTNDNQMGGWSSSEQRNLFFYERARNNLIDLGVPAKSIEVLPEPVSSTYDEAALVQAYTKSNAWQSLLIVTSPYHSRRALWTIRRVFQGTGVTIGLEPVPVGDQSPGTWTWWLHLRGWKAVPLEYAKMVYYRWRFAS